MGFGSLCLGDLHPESLGIKYVLEGSLRPYVISNPVDCRRFFEGRTPVLRTDRPLRELKKSRSQRCSLFVGKILRMTHR